MAFDEARRSGAGSISRGNSSRATAGGFGGVGAGVGYQGGDADAAYSRVCSGIEDELRRLTASVAALRKHVDAVGSSRDSDDLRSKIGAAVTKGKEAVATVNSLLNKDLAAAVDSVTLSAKERSARRMQQQRYMGSYKDAIAAYTEVATAADAAMRKHPAPPNKGSIVSAGEGGSKRGGARGAGIGAKSNRNEEDALLRMQQVDFEASLVEEREENITDIASAISQVNETFRDLAQIVEDQGHDIATIDVNVTSAEAHTEEGVGHLTQAEKYQKGYRKWIIAVLLTIILAAAGIGGYFIVKSRGS